MMFHYLAVNTNAQGTQYVSSKCYHKNAHCSTLNGVDTVLRITGEQKGGFEPCGVCYNDK